MDQLEAGLRTARMLRVTAAGPVPDSHRLPDSPQSCMVRGTSSCWSGSGYPCRETRDEAIDIRAVVQPDDDEVRVGLLDFRDQLVEQMARSPGPSQDVLGVGEHGTERRLLVAV